MISPDEAWRLLALRCSPLDPADLSRRDCLGTVLARDLRATVDVPFADVSAMDGYAVGGRPRAGDSLPVTGTVAAGDPPGRTLDPGTAVRIMTGAPVPEGTSRVVPVELTDGGTEEVTFTRDAAERGHIRRRGEATARGEVILPAGTTLGAAALGLAATHGIATLSVVRPPRVAVLVTGDEVVPPEGTVGPGQLRDSHSDLLLAAGLAGGVETTSLGIAPDRPDAIAEALSGGLDHDVVLVTGGVSKGEHDYGAGVLEELGFEILFHGVAVQPGKPLVAAVRATDGRRTVAFGLPGNPAAVIVCRRLFVQPVLDRLAGRPRDLLDDALDAVLAAEAPGAKSRARFLPARVEIVDGGLRATPISQMGSHDLAAYARGNALLEIPAGSDPAPAGNRRRVVLLAGFGP